MKLNLKRALSGVVAVAAAASAVPLFTATAAFASPPAPQSPGAGVTPTSGIGSTAFQLTLPSGAACPGDSPNAGWRWQTYMVPSSVDPATLTYGSNGPLPAGVGASFRQPLYTPAGSPIVNQQTPAADTPGGPGPIVNIPQADFQVFSPGNIPAGVYNVGIACTLGAASSTQLDKFWNLRMTVTTNAAGGNAQISWAQGAVPNTPVLNTVTPGNGTLTAAFTQPAGSDPAITGFTATATPTGGGSAVTTTGTTSPLTFTGLTNGTAYAVTVHATNSVGNSPESNSISGTPNITRQPVQNLSATPGTGKVDLSWQPPSDAASQPPTGYTIGVSPATTGTVNPSPVTGTTATISGLTAGTLYTFTVTPTYSSGPAGAPASVQAAPFDAQVLKQDVTVTRPAGAIVLTQICGNHGDLPADTRGTPGFPNGSLPAVAAASPGTTPTLDSGAVDPRFGGYPYPTDANEVPNPNYPTHCGIDLGTAKFVKSGAGAGQFFATNGLLNQVTVVDTRDTDTGWTVSGQMSDFVNQTDNTKKFSGSELGWEPVKTTDTAAFTDSDGFVYDQVVVAGNIVDPNSLNAVGLSTGRRLGHADGLTSTGPSSATGGFGIAALDARLKLLIPVTKRSGVYTGTLTITVTGS